jgi:hypothetical protein
MLISSFTLGSLWYPLPRFSSGSGHSNYMNFSVTFLTFVVGQIIQNVLVSNYCTYKHKSKLVDTVFLCAVSATRERCYIGARNFFPRLVF